MRSWYEWREAPEAEFAVIGDPIGHSLSPTMHQAWLDSIGSTMRYVAIRVWQEELDEALGHLKSRGYLGLNATLPIKERLAERLPNVDGFARKIGAVNTVDLRQNWGANTDAPGFLATLDAYELSPGDRALILGAGGSARAVAAALCAIGIKVRLWNRSRDRAEGLASDLGDDIEVMDIPDPSGVSLVVNATAGVSETELPVLWDRFKPGAFAYDLMYGRETEFMGMARSRRIEVCDGLGMLVEQGALSMEMWTGDSVDRSVMLRAVENAIG